MKRGLIVMLISLFSILNTSFSYNQEELEAANFLWAKWIIVNRSTSVNEYNLDKEILRQEIAWVALALSWLKAQTYCDGIFTDVTRYIPNDWACMTIESLANNWLISLNDRFRPEDYISKAEAVWMVVKAVFGNDYKYNSYSTKTWQEQVVEYAVNKWLTTNFYNYDTSAKRGFIFVIAQNALEIKWWNSQACILPWQCDNNAIPPIIENNQTTLNLKNNTSSYVDVRQNAKNETLFDFNITNSAWNEVQIVSIKPKVWYQDWNLLVYMSNFRLYNQSRQIASSNSLNFENLYLPVQKWASLKLRISADVNQYARIGDTLELKIDSTAFNIQTIPYGWVINYSWDINFNREFKVISSSSVNPEPPLIENNQTTLSITNNTSTTATILSDTRYQVLLDFNIKNDNNNDVKIDHIIPRLLNDSSNALSNLSNFRLEYASWEIALSQNLSFNNLDYILRKWDSINFKLKADLNKNVTDWTNFSLQMWWTAIWATTTSWNSVSYNSNSTFTRLFNISNPSKPRD